MTVEGSSSDQCRFREFICRYAPILYLLLLIVTVLFFLNLVAMLIDTQPADAFIISIMNFALLGTTATGILLILWYCQRD